MIAKLPRKKTPVKRQVNYLLSLSLLLIAIEFINSFSGRMLNQFGLIPGTTSGLFGIFVSPFLHGNWAHLFSNLPPLLVFSLLMFQHGRWRFTLATVGIVVLGGGLVWLFGRTAIHVGASGLVFGYFGYLIIAGLISKEVKLLMIAIVVGISYGGMLIGILPLQAFVSFESHLFGLLAGVAMALLLGQTK